MARRGVEELADRTAAAGRTRPRRWAGALVAGEIGPHELQIEAWTDRFATWRHDAEIKASANDPDLEVVLEEGARLLDRLAKRVDKASRGAVLASASSLRDQSRPLDERLTSGLDQHVAAILTEVPDPTDLTRTKAQPLWVDRRRAREGAWYELFPRSEGGLAPATKRLAGDRRHGLRRGVPAADAPDRPHVPQGPGQHARRAARRSRQPVGHRQRGGRPHSPSHPELGTIDDFDAFVDEREPTRPRGRARLRAAVLARPSVGHASIPSGSTTAPTARSRTRRTRRRSTRTSTRLNFWPERGRDRVALWEACQEIFEYWIEHGVRDLPRRQPAHEAVRVLGVDDPSRPRRAPRRGLPRRGVHAAAGDGEARRDRLHAELHVLHVADREVGARELPRPSSPHGPKADCFRPNFWPNTPDILAGPLRNGPPAAFRLRLVLAATLGPSYGIYSGYELCENEPASGHQRGVPALREVRDQDTGLGRARTRWRRSSRWSTTSAIATTRSPSCARSRFHHVDNDEIIAYSKRRGDGDDVILSVVNLDPNSWHEATLSLDLDALGLDRRRAVRGLRRVDRRQRIRGWAPSRTSGSTRPSSRPRLPRPDRLMATPIDWADSRWYQRAVFYEVLVRGFYDSQRRRHRRPAGLTDKLDYLEWLGVDCLWLLPFYQSPLRDGGYDISDFFTVLPDVRRPGRRRRAHRGGPPPRHPRHRRPGDEPHQRPAPVVPGEPPGPRQPQGRLVRLERRRPALVRGADHLRRHRDRRTGPGTRQREQYYWHRFFHHQPDLNYDNPEVQEAMLDVVRFWLDLGLDGFRLDAVPYLFERDGTNGENLPETHEYLKRLRKEVDAEFPGRGAARRGQPVAGRRRRLLRRRRRVPHVLPLPADAAHVHGRAPRAALPDHRDPGPDARRSPTAASGASSCATTTS